MKQIAILGSTGSVGTQTLDVVRKHPDKLKVTAIVAHHEVEELVAQAREFSPKWIGIADASKAKDLEGITGVPVLSGSDVTTRVAEEAEYDTLVSATVGLTGIRAALSAIRRGKQLALANKETLVAAGEIVMAEAKKHNAVIMPIDSEHSALFQCLNGESSATVHSLILTCSGGALRDKTREELKSVSIEDALGHKTWKMGQKITVDSATLMNKGFEVIEAMWLYDVAPENIRVVIHPQSIIHSMVEYSDGSVLAQMSDPDMRLPIQYALSYPERWDAPIQRLSFDRALTFDEPDLERFPCLGYAFEAMKTLGTLPAVMNAVNDVMVGKFLAGKCRYVDIARVIKQVMEGHTVITRPTLEDIENAINEAGQATEDICKKIRPM